MIGDRFSAKRFTRALLLTIPVTGTILCSGLHAHATQSAKQDEQDPTNWPDVIAKLRQDVEHRPGQAFVRQQLALAYNNYGVSLGQQGQWDQAIQQLQEALQLDRTNQRFRNNLCNILFNRAHQAYQQRHINEAVETLDQLLTVNPNFSPAYILRGDIEYDRQKLKEARTAWEQALKLDPTQHQLTQKIAQVSHELPVESKFERLSQAYFDLRYEEQLERPVGFDIRDDLLEARRLVGSDFSYWPKQRIVVLIYSAESFRSLRQETPDWVGGQFDGKIRVPLPGVQVDLSTVKQILFHEYTHAVIHDLTTGKCPVWLNEGLAEYEGARFKSLSLPHLVRAFQSGRLISWSQLSAQFSAAMPVNEVALGYQESHSIAQYFITRYGFWRIRRLLKALGEGQAWDAALSDEFRMKLPKLEANWRDWLSEFLKNPS